MAYGKYLYTVQRQLKLPNMHNSIFRFGAAR